jgi:hypothetical protein
MRDLMKGVVAAFGLSVGVLAAAPAGAEIVNLSANGAFVPYTFTAGRYKIEWIGVADGGDYDAAFINACPPTAGCTSGYSNAFVAVRLPATVTDNESSLFTRGQLYGTALQSLAAYQAGPVFNFSREVIGGVVQPLVQEPNVPNPWIIDAPNDAMFALRVLDSDGDFTGNTGGVSLRISTLVPEPATWALMIAGFGLAGASLRSRRMVVARR